MELTHKQKQQLREALIHAFPSKDDLKIMLSDGLGWDLDRVAGGNTLEKIVFNLLIWTESRGQLKQLLEAAIASNPFNYKLNNLKKSYLNPITQDEINNLKLILDQIDFSIIKSSFLKILPDGAREDNVGLNEVKSTDDIIKNLCENYSSTSSNVPRIIKLGEDIISNSENDESKELVCWLNQVSSRLGIEIFNVPPQQFKSSYHLLFLVYPEGESFRIETAYTQDGITKALDSLQDTNSASVSVNSQYRKGILCPSFQEVPKVLDRIIKD
ncbi:hypothetical protein F7734_17780, partial [Scytonema sp. UIC 10036]|uniref:effector-associated domain EAD1-containing protein n=1 Tax=Scytonema sp. UIC 10036 TaxID=2304196 RepID=UPI001385C12B